MESVGYCGKIWANGEFGFSREKKFKPHRTIRRTKLWKEEINTQLLKQVGVTLAMHIASIVDAPSSSIALIEGDSCPIAEGWTRALGLSQVAKSHRAKRGQSGISRYGAKLVRNGAYVMEKEGTLSRLSFVTLTLPNVSRAESIKVCEAWAEIVRVFVQRLRRILIRRSLPGEIIGCTEVQEGRASLTGVFGLHLHFVFVGRKKKESWAVRISDLESAWKSALSPYLESPVETYNWKAVSRMESLRKTASGYLGKYMSKGLKACQKLKAMFPEVELPACWYVCTNSLRVRVKSQMIRVTGELGKSIAEFLDDADGEWVAYHQTIYVQLERGQIPIGSMGRLTEKGRRLIDQLAHSSREEEFMRGVIFGKFSVKEG